MNEENDGVCLCRLINLGEALIVPGQMFPTPYFGFLSFNVLCCDCAVLFTFSNASVCTHTFFGVPQLHLPFVTSIGQSIWKLLYAINNNAAQVWPEKFCLFELKECGGSALFPRQGTVCAHQGLQLSHSLSSHQYEQNEFSSSIFVLYQKNLSPIMHPLFNGVTFFFNICKMWVRLGIFSSPWWLIIECWRFVSFVHIMSGFLFSIWSSRRLAWARCCV